MAHECPDCGQVCYCNGDVDDCVNNFSRDQLNCSHWLQCESENEEEGDDTNG